MRLLKSGLSTLFIFALSNFPCLTFAASATPTSKQTATTTMAAITQEKQHYIDAISKRYHIAKQSLETLLLNRQPNQKIINAMTRPFESSPWHGYSAYFLKPERITQGVAYWQTHEKALQYAQTHYGVDPSIIVAILGVETKYGQFPGTFKIIDALNTLAFYYPSRHEFFQKELTEYLLLTREQKINPEYLEGSYAGAIGIPQFMPSSYRYYGVDYSRDGQVDLLRNHDDAIVSIANYLHKNGWERGKPVAEQNASNAKMLKQLACDNARVVYSAKTLEKRGISLKQKVSPTAKASIINLPLPTGPNYWVTYTNFRTIMSYNPSTLYAMAVYQLAEKLKEVRSAQLATGVHSSSVKVS